MPRVLIVDDEPHRTSSLRDWLSHQGHEVKATVSLQDAIEWGTSWQPHVLLIANWTPQCPLDGPQLAASLRAGQPELQTILIAGDSSPELRARAEEARIFCVLEEPFSLEGIAEMVDKAARESLRNSAGRLLLVSDSAVVREAIVDMLQAAGWVCHVEDSHAQARQALENNPEISVAILDCLEPTPDQGLLAAELREVRPGVTIIGCSEQAADKLRFADLGITDFVPRYWRIADLVNLLAVPIKNCVECGLPLPLLRATPRDNAQSWACGMCGARYRAMLPDNAPEDLRRNVRSVP